MRANMGGGGNKRDSPLKIRKYYIHKLIPLSDEMAPNPSLEFLPLLAPSLFLRPLPHE